MVTDLEVILSHLLSPAHEPERAASPQSMWGGRDNVPSLHQGTHHFCILNWGVRRPHPDLAVPEEGAVNVRSPYSGRGKAQHKINAALTQPFLVGL